jgi:pimeloyl-ACP methyl ester carboxylesterase
VTLNYERRGSGEPLVLLHGVGASLRSYEPVLDGLAAERDVIAIDFPGFGDSTPLPTGVEPSPSRMAAEVAALLDRLEVERPAVAGHSMGGWIALELAAMGRVGAVTALAPALWSSTAAAAFTTEQLRPYLAFKSQGDRLERLARWSALRTILLWPNSAAPWKIPGAAAGSLIKGAVESVGFGPTLTAMRRHRFERWSDVHVPVTVVWGDKERLILRRHAEPLAARKLPHSRTYGLERCGHLVMWDSPAETLRILLEEPGPPRQVTGSE